MLHKLIAECSDYDFKEKLEVKKPKSWLKSISAFSNGLGGYLFFGITNDKKLIGVDNPQFVCDKISELINSKISPVPKFILETYRENNLVMLLLKPFQARQRHIIIHLMV